MRSMGETLTLCHENEQLLCHRLVFDTSTYKLVEISTVLIESVAVLMVPFH
jgi:hypothetical protein